MATGTPGHSLRSVPQTPYPQSDPGSAAMTDEQKRTLAVLLVPTFVSLLAVSSINVVLPTLRTDLHASTAGIQWIISGYTLVFGILLVPAGRAGDVLGRARLFTIGLALFGLGSLGAGLAPSILLLNAARVVMGIGSGLLNPQVTGMIQRYYHGAQRGKAFGMLGGTVGVSVAFGPVLAGLLVEWLGADWGWRTSFLINVPIALGGACAATRVLPASAWTGSEVAPVATPADGAGRRRRRLDLDPVGMVLLGVTILLVLMPFIGTSDSVLRWLALPAAGLLLLGWILWERAYERRGREPMVALALFTQRSFSNGTLLISLYFLGSTSVWLVIAQYLQAGLGDTALQSGLMGIPAAIAGAVISPLLGRHVLRLGRPMVMWGMVVVAAGVLATAWVVHMVDTAGWSQWWMLVSTFVIGAAGAFVVSPNQTLTLVDVPLEYAGAAGGVMQTGQRIGTAVGVAAITNLLYSVLPEHGWAKAFIDSFELIAVIMLLAAVIALVDIVGSRRDRRRPRIPAPGE